MTLAKDSVVLYPLSTEKAVRFMESENTLLFVVALKATKAEIKKAVADLFGVEVVSVRTLITHEGVKRAFVKLGGKSIASDIMAQLGLV